MLALGSDPDLVLWRNSVVGGTGSDGRQLHGGLPNGSADLVGVRAPYGRFFALEVKLRESEIPPPLAVLEERMRSGGPQPPKGFLHKLDQRRWQRLVHSKGGFCAFVCSVPEAWAALARAKAGELE